MLFAHSQFACHVPFDGLLNKVAFTLQVCGTKHVRTLPYFQKSITHLKGIGKSCNARKTFHHLRQLWTLSHAYLAVTVLMVRLSLLIRSLLGHFTSVTSPVLSSSRMMIALLSSCPRSTPWRALLGSAW